jgi:hypothetical protein
MGLSWSRGSGVAKSSICPACALGWWALVEIDGGVARAELRFFDDRSP